MDKSETYIKMCEKAEEIQALRTGGLLDNNNSQVGDWWATYKAETGDYEISCMGTGHHLYYRYPQLVWLPHQDQLQEMAKDSDSTGWATVSDLIYKLHNFYNRRDSDYPMSFTSMEQLWLAFVQKELYGLIWNGEDWVKEE